MILAWMLFATAFAALVGIAALAADHVAAALHRPRRLIWIGALLLSMAWPALALLRALAPSGQSARAALLPPTYVTATVERASALMTRGTAALPPSTDLVLAVAWLGLSALLLVRIVLGTRALERRRGDWRAASLDGVPVRLAPDAGPAVVGVRAMEIVLPDWILTLDAPLRALVLRHEEEHRRARDPMLTLLAAIATALVPWNPALWWQARRIRLALEMDCDARVLGAHPTPERYGLLLLTIAQRRSITTPLLAPALSEPASNLERRILAMRMLATRRSVVNVAAAAALASAAIVVACAVDAPTAPGPDARPSSAVAPTPPNANQTYFEFQVEKQVAPLPNQPAPRYPDTLRSANVEGDVLAQFVVDTSGHAEPSTFKVLKSSHEAFTQAVRSDVLTMRFVAAEVGGHKVKQLVQMPFVFRLTQ